MNTQETELLESWEEIYKRGLLTLWVLLAVQTSPKGPAEVATYIEKYSKESFFVNSQSLHRALRRFYDAGFLEIIRGPDGRKKIYQLTDLGRNILKRFLQRNILPFYSEPLHQHIIEATT